MKKIVLVLVITMAMVISLSVDKADAENWIFWNYRADSDEGKYSHSPNMLGAFDSYAACKAEEKAQCESLGAIKCKKVSGGICDQLGSMGQYGTVRYYDCWKCYPQGINPSGN